MALNASKSRSLFGTCGLKVKNTGYFLPDVTKVDGTTITKSGEFLVSGFSVVYCSSSFMFRVPGAKLRRFSLVVFQAL